MIPNRPTLSSLIDIAAELLRDAIKLVILGEEPPVNEDNQKHESDKAAE